MNLSEKFDRIYNKANTESFLSIKALKRLKSRLYKCGIKYENINLYNFPMRILKNRGILHKLAKEEETGFKKKQVFQLLNAVLDAESKGLK